MSRGRVPLIDFLANEGLLRESGAELQYERQGAGRPLEHLELLRLCHQGVLEGGMSVALDVRPDELMGPLLVTLGGSARRLRLTDVRDRPVPQLCIQLDEVQESWEVEDLYGLVHNVNELLKDESSVRAAAVLGEWEDMLQLWCVRKQHLRLLLKQPWFAPQNRSPLERMTARRA